MARTPEEMVEAKVMDAARHTPYPPTPDLAASVMRRLERRQPPVSRALARAAAILVVVMAALFVTMPEVRAAVLSLLRIGGVTLLREAPTPAPTLDLVQSVLLLEGRTTLQAARESLPFDMLLPTYPPDLGNPDHIFVPEHNSVVMVWTEADAITLVLTIHAVNQQMFKYYPWEETATLVDGQYAAWLTEPHTMFDAGGDVVTRRIIHDHVLIWYTDDVTYRLETDLTMAEAVKIAESLE